MESLWPEDIGTIKQKSPSAILREQAAFLANKTMNLVQAEVVPANESGEFFRHRFMIVAPSLGNYRYELMIIYHEIELYPVKIFLDEEALLELASNHKVESVERHADAIVADSEEEFLAALKDIFSASKTRKVLNALLAQADPNYDDIPF